MERRAINTKLDKAMAPGRYKFGRGRRRFLVEDRAMSAVPRQPGVQFGLNELPGVTSLEPHTFQNIDDEIAASRQNIGS